MTIRQRWRRFTDRDQVLLVGLAVHAALVGALLSWETYVTGAGRFLWPAVWPAVFVAAAAAVLVYHRDRASRLAWRASGALLLACYLSRALIICAEMVAVGGRARLGVGATTWAVVAFVVWLAWTRTVLPRKDA